MNLNPLIILLLSVFLFRCDESAPESDEKKYHLKITGIKESINYEFSGRTNDIDAIANLSLLITDLDNNIIYDAWYNTNNNASIPDTVLIPALPANDYKLYLSTAPGHNYEFSDSASAYYLTYWTISAGPIYADFQDFSLSEENQELHLSLTNISTRISTKVSNGESIQSNQYYSFALYNDDVNSYFFESNSFKKEYKGGTGGFWGTYFFLPMTVHRIWVSFYDGATHHGKEITLEEPIILNTGDAITFSIDHEKFMEESSVVTFQLDEISWNDLGEITIP